jgi:uncharacterized protein (TIGR01777 family)
MTTSDVTTPPPALPAVVLAGGSGSLGLRLAAYFAGLGHQVIILTRHIRPGVEFRQVYWDGRTVDASWGHLLPGSILVNLAGELVDRRPTRKNVALLRDSRVEPTKALSDASHVFGAPSVWLQMSTLAIYGDAGEKGMTEQSPAADGPAQMAGVAKAWEGALEDVNADRLVVMRTGIVLEAGTPALNRLVSMTRWGLGGTVGSGDQWVSWIHVDDFVAAVGRLAADETLSGVVHLSAPNPVRNVELMAGLRKALRKGWVPRTPAFAISLGAWVLLGTDPALALTGRHATPGVLTFHGFRFTYLHLEDALADLLG